MVWCNSIISIFWNTSLSVIPRSTYFFMSIAFEILLWAPNSCAGTFYNNWTYQKDCTCFIFFGLGKRWIASTFSGAVVITFDDNLKPKNWTSLNKNLDFSNFKVTLFSDNFLSTFSQHYSQLLDVINKVSTT